MYSVVLMAALTAGTSTPTWGCHGCHGGFGGFGGFGCHGFFAGCRGGFGGCYGSGGAGSAYYGGCYGCYGGACYGGVNYTGYGSGCYGYVGGGCHGCHGGATSYGPAQPPIQVTPPATPPGRPEQIPPPKKEEKSASLNQARLIVELPADAKLYVDDRLTKAISERRVFNSPQLEEGQTYYYILRAEVVRDGQTLSETKRVLLHARDVVQASFKELGASATARAEASGGQ